MRIIFFILSILFVTPAFAICPICTFAVGAGIGLAQYCGVDDTITGLWIGGLIVSLIVWTTHWLTQRNIKFFGRKILIVVGYYALTIIPLYITHHIGHPLNKLWGYDKILLGIAIGSVALALGSICYTIIKKHNGDKAWFPFQKVVMPVLPLIILSVVFYFITR
ncbi:MAG: hypothetical protein M1561_01770 [Gammaproteobacteria bacterium]|nr:hypothetical protein [Gammaproteobacteria bacterium]